MIFKGIVKTVYFKINPLYCATLKNLLPLGFNHFIKNSNFIPIASLNLITPKNRHILLYKILPYLNGTIIK